MEIYQIIFYYDYGEEAIDECTLWLGCYRSLENAENYLSSYQKKKGFNLFPDKYFYIEEKTVDKDENWLEGFCDMDDPNWDEDEKNYHTIKGTQWISTENLDSGKTDKVYMVVHQTPYGELNEHMDEKFIGIYSTPNYAEEAVNRYFTYEGFNRRPKSYFKMIPFILDQNMYYKDGFTPIYNPTEYDYCTEETTTIQILNNTTE